MLYALCSTCPVLLLPKKALFAPKKNCIGSNLTYSRQLFSACQLVNLAPDSPSRHHLRRCLRSLLLAAYCSIRFSRVAPRRFASNTLLEIRKLHKPLLSIPITKLDGGFGISERNSKHPPPLRAPLHIDTLPSESGSIMPLLGASRRISNGQVPEKRRKVR